MQGHWEVDVRLTATGCARRFCIPQNPTRNPTGLTHCPQRRQHGADERAIDNPAPGLPRISDFGIKTFA